MARITGSHGERSDPQQDVAATRAREHAPTVDPSGPGDVRGVITVHPRRLPGPFFIRPALRRARVRRRADDIARQGASERER